MNDMADTEIEGGRLLRVERSRSDVDIVNELQHPTTGELVAYEIVTKQGTLTVDTDGITPVVVDGIKIRAARKHWWSRKR